MTDPVWVELDSILKLPIRIFKSWKAAVHLVSRGSAHSATEMEYATAVRLIRHQLFLRSYGYCQLCAVIVTEQGCHMHERIHRGRFDVDGYSGEISLTNSIIVCAKCHRLQHPEREIQFTRRQS